MGVTKVLSDFSWFQGPTVLLFCTNKSDGTLLFLGVYSSDKEKIIFPLLQMGKKKVKQVDQCHKRELKSFLEPQWSLTQTAHFVYMQRSATILLLGLHCNQETKVQKAVFNKYIIYPLEVFSF